MIRSILSMVGGAGQGLALNIFSDGFWRGQWMDRPAASPLSARTDDMFMWIWWFCVIWFVLLMALMGYFVVAYRRKPGQIAPRSPSHNTVIELLWTIIPTLFLAWIFFRGFHTYMDKMISPGNAVEMNLTGWKWSWKIEYPNGFESSAQTQTGARPIPVFYMPGGQPMKFRMNSLDVMHAFWVPDLRIKQDVIPNRYTTMWIEFDAPKDWRDTFTYPASKEDAEKDPKLAEFRGENFNPALAGVTYTEHRVFCAEYCGTEHSEMAAIIRVIPVERYPAFLESIGEGKLPLLELGKRTYKTKCASCHTIDGSKNTGPTWKNLFGYESEFEDGSRKVVDENHVHESIRQPAKHIRKGFTNGMTPWSENLLSEKHVSGVIAYMKTLSDKGGATPAPDAAPAADEKK